MEHVLDFLRNLRFNVRLADILDIAVVAVVLYVVLTRLKNRASRVVPIGVAAVLLLYVLANRLDMYLTSVLFQAGLAGAVVALVVIFQDDLRRAFQRLASLQARPRRRPTGHSVGLLVEAMTRLAGDRIGALVVLPGREPIEPYTRGGIAVGGRVSVPLLLSIFHPASAGHDGAVVLRGDRIEMFGAHLPLSENLAALGERGTRHAAGLGLTELTDALVVIVSEERGVVSVARDGRLDSGLAADELTARLEEHTQRLVTSGVTRPLLGWLRGNLGAKLLAPCLAALLWGLVAFRIDTVQRTLTVPIEFTHIPAGLVFEDADETQANVTFIGSERVFDLLDPNSVLISLDLAELEEGPQRIMIEADDVRRPEGLQVRAIHPGRVRLTLEPAGAP